MTDSFGGLDAAVIEALRQTASEAYHRWYVGRMMPQPIERAGCLYHYTSAGGLTGILHSNALWASDTAFLNDTQEIAFAAEPLTERMRQRVEEALAPYASGSQRRQRRKSEELRDSPFLYRVRSLLSASEFISNFACAQREEIAEQNDLYVTGSTFVACLSEDHDQLGQWRGYGKGGYAIGFWKDHLTTAAPILGKVVYGADEVARLIDRVLDHFETRAVTEEVERDGYIEAVSYCLPQIALIKHAAFQQEREWRLIVPRYDLDFSEIAVRAAGETLIPYVSCPFDKAAVAEIVIGPGGDLHSERAVRTLLHSHGYNPDNVQISHSTAPFRG